MRLFIISSLFVFLFSVNAVSGQPPVITAVEQAFAFDPYPDDPARISNELLQRISQGTGRLRAYTRFTVGADVILQLDRQPTGQVMASVRIGNINYSGDIMYRDFSLEKILLPNRMDLTLQVLDASGQVISQIPLKDTSVPANGGGVLKLELPQEVQAQAASLKPGTLRLYYSAEAFERFDGWFDALEEYYAAGSKLEQAGGLIQDLDVSQVETMMLEEFSLCEAEGLYRSVRHGTFHHWIDLQRSDPEQILKRLQELEKKLVVQRQNFNASVAVIDSLFYQEGLVAAREERSNDARALFANVVTYNPFHIESHLAIAGIDLQKGDKKPALKRMGQVIAKMYPAEQERREALEITADILDVFFSEARELTWAHRYLSALETLEPVEAFCHDVEGFMECPFELEYRITASHVGMYRSFLTVSARARQDNNLSFAQTYIMSALEYQQQNSRYLPDDREAMEQMQMVLSRYVENGIMNMELQDYEKAAAEFAQALSLFETFPRLVCPPEVESLLGEASRLDKEHPRDSFIEQQQEVLPGKRPLKGPRKESAGSLNH